MPPFSPARTYSHERLDLRRLGAGAPGAPGGQLQFALMLMAVFIALFYFLLIRPQQKRAKDHQALMSQARRGR